MTKKKNHAPEHYHTLNRGFKLESIQAGTASGIKLKLFRNLKSESDTMIYSCRLTFTLLIAYFLNIKIGI